MDDADLKIVNGLRKAETSFDPVGCFPKASLFVDAFLNMSI
jgi:hypothetical protein